MTTTIVRPDSATAGTVIRNNASDMASSTAIELLVAQPEHRVAEPLSGAHASGAEFSAANTGMTEDDTVSVLEVLAEMQRIIDRHIEKTEKQQGDR